MTPTEAIDSGSDYLVIGRPITQSDNPSKVLDDINISLKQRENKVNPAFYTLMRI